MAWDFYLEGKTDSETMYWKYALGTAFLKLFPSSQVPNQPISALARSQQVPVRLDRGTSASTKGFTCVFWSPECP